MCDVGRLPHVALFSSLPHGVSIREIDRPLTRWEVWVLEDLATIGASEEDWEAQCGLKGGWRKRVWEFSDPGRKVRRQLELRKARAPRCSAVCRVPLLALCAACCSRG